MENYTPFNFILVHLKNMLDSLFMLDLLDDLNYSESVRYSQREKCV